MTPIKAHDLFDQENNPRLNRPTQIPIGFIHEIPHYIFLAEGTMIQEIPDRISRMREQIGLPPKISNDEVEKLFQSTVWMQARAHSIYLPFAGLIKHLMVHKGQEIKKDQVIFIIEAMKMECQICAPADGKIIGIPVRESEIVEDHAVLMNYIPSVFEWETIETTLLMKNKGWLRTLFPWMEQIAQRSALYHFSSKQRVCGLGGINVERQGHSINSTKLEYERRLITPSSFFSSPYASLLSAKSNSKVRKMGKKKIGSNTKTQKVESKKAIEKLSTKRIIMHGTQRIRASSRVRTEEHSPFRLTIPELKEGIVFNTVNGIERYYLFLVGFISSTILARLSLSLLRRRNKKLKDDAYNHRLFPVISFNKQITLSIMWAHNMNRHYISNVQRA
ncbi:MAG: acetyl-CoA carboxylase biotin carboxyl carrier protein subunit [Alphaproteobacteria bacterium]|nr:acetyl-CoA carboxylase biotin carboxyl carrier protein subunit [Alphaproteobacteria bacterium]